MGLTSLAHSLKIENCLTRRGVVAALTDPDYGDSKPYVSHSIPGTIPAAYYDIGARGLSYSDSDYWNDGDGGYNDGWVFRNDGVDVEGSDDDDIPYTVGWTEAESGWDIRFKTSLQEPMRFHLIFLHQKLEESFLHN